MPPPVAMSQLGTRRWPSRTAFTSGMGAVGCGILLGMIVLTVSERPTRWLVYALVGLAVTVVVLVSHARRRQLVTCFIIGLSFNLYYYITQSEELLFIGASSRSCFFIPFVLLPAVALAIWAALDAIAGRRPLSRGLPVSKFAVLVIATATISTMFSTVRRYGIYNVVELLQYLFIYLVTVNIIHTEEDLDLVIGLLLVTLAIQSVVFLIQTATGATFTMTGEVSQGAGLRVVRATGTVGLTPGSYSNFIEPILFSAYALWRTRDSGVSRIWTGCLTVVGSVTLVLTLDRTAWVTLPLGISVVEILCRRRGVARKLSRATIVTMATCVILAAIVIIPLIIPRLNDSHGDDWTIRKNLMFVAMRMIAGNPIVGVGPGAYPFHIQEYMIGGVTWVWVVHNEYMLIWAERGILGLVAYLAWMRSGLQQAVLASTVQARKFQAFGIGCVAGVVGLLWEGTLNYYPSFCCYALLWAIFGILVAGNNIYAQAEASDHSNADPTPLRLSAASV